MTSSAIKAKQLNERVQRDAVFRAEDAREDADEPLNGLHISSNDDNFFYSFPFDSLQSEVFGVLFHLLHSNLLRQ